MPLRHFANRTILVCIVLSTVIGVGLFSVVSYVPTYIQMAYRTSATVSGLVPIATVFGMLVSHAPDRLARQPLGPLPRLPDLRHRDRRGRAAHHGAAAGRACRCGCRWWRWGSSASAPARS